jgi:hypothetical protein
MRRIAMPDPVYLLDGMELYYFPLLVGARGFLYPLIKG